MIGIRLLLFKALVILAGVSNANNFYNVKDYGAVANGEQIVTLSIQKAIDECHENGGGTVYFPAGTYLSGTIELKSNITLFLDAGSVLKGSPNIEDYENSDFKSHGKSKWFIFAYRAENVSIKGQGLIHGNDSAFFNWNEVRPALGMDSAYTRQGEKYRIRFPDASVNFKYEGGSGTARPGAMFALVGCKRITIRDISIRGSAGWCMHIACSDGVNIQGVDIRNSLVVPNADAIDVSTSRNIVIADSYLEAGDDVIAISPCADGFCSQPAENITVSNCNIVSRAAGIRIGWGENDFRNFTFQNLVIHSNRGILINARLDETIENIRFDNIIIHTRLHTARWGNGEPIHISEIPTEGRWPNPNYVAKKPGTIRNIFFSNITITGESGNVIYAHTPHAVSNIFFSNVVFHFKDSPLNEEFGGNFDFRPSFSDSHGVFKHDIPAMFVHGVKGLYINNFHLTADDQLPQFCTEGLFISDCFDVKIDRFSGAPLRKGPAIRVEESGDVRICNSKALLGTGTFVSASQTKNIEMYNNDLEKSEVKILVN